ncbi:MAG: SufS family cysteine desulfurase, partial [bacterium]
MIEVDDMPVLTATHGARKPFDVKMIRQDFPILNQRIHGKPLAYLDNAATSQKPQAVIDAIMHYYTAQNANIHRGVYYLSEMATKAYEDSREYIRDFLNAKSTREIIFARGATEGINLVASAFGGMSVKDGDEIIISAMEHHSNIVPWQILCAEKGAKLRVIPINDAGEIVIDEYAKMLNEKTKLVALAQISNSLGTINPVRRMIRMAHEIGAVVLIDGAQAVPHAKVDVQALGADFYTFSGHKAFGPTGAGVLYGKEELLESMPPYQGGGDMIKTVTFEKTIYSDLPYKFEAGTPNIAGGIALAKALEYVENVGYGNIAAHENELLQYATEMLLAIDGLKIIGTAKEKASVISFVIDGIHPHDVGTILDHEGVAI